MDDSGGLGICAGNGHPVADGQPVTFTMVASPAVIGDGEYARHPRGVEVEEGKVNGAKGEGVRNQTAVPILGDALARAEVRHGEAGEDIQRELSVPATLMLSAHPAHRDFQSFDFRQLKLLTVQMHIDGLITV